VVDDDTPARAWEEFDVTSAVKRHVTAGGGGGKAAGLLRLRVRVGGAERGSRRRLVFGEDRCDDALVTALRHRHHPVLNVLTRDRSVVLTQPLSALRHTHTHMHMHTHIRYDTMFCSVL